jgi:isopropylmalate/homocitrate/citramalate synthase
MPQIHLIDTTNRDGVRTANLCLSPLQKTMINLQVNDLGLGESEIGVAATRYEHNYINGNCKLAEIGVLTPIRLRGWITAIDSDVEAVIKNTQLKHLYMAVPSYQPLIRSKFGEGYNLERVVDDVCRSIAKAKKAGIQTVTVGKTDSSRSSDQDLMMVARKVREAGADRYRYCDTWGYENPWTIRERVKKLAAEIKIPIEIHCHDDLGLAVANSIAGALGALDAGVDAYITTTVHGVGERAGNADMISTILTLLKSKELRDKDLLADSIKLHKAWRLARYAAYALKWPISPRQVAFGEYASMNTTGVHVDGAVREVQACEVYNVEELGRAEPDLVETGRWIMTGGYTGVRGFRNIYGKLEIEFKNEEEAHLILDLTRMANMQNHLPLTGDELRFIARHPEIARQIMSQNW